MNAIGLISSDIKWASQREEWLFYSLSQLVKDVKLTFTVWASTLTWCFIDLVWQLIRMHPVVRYHRFLFVLEAEAVGGAKMRWVGEMSTGPSVLCVLWFSLFFLFILRLPLSAFSSLVVIPGLCEFREAPARWEGLGGLWQPGGHFRRAAAALCEGLPGRREVVGPLRKSPTRRTYREPALVLGCDDDRWRLQQRPSSVPQPVFQIFCTLMFLNTANLLDWYWKCPKIKWLNHWV